MNEKSENIGHSLERVYPPQGLSPDMSNYVTRIELSTTVKALETKVENSELKQRNWVLGGVVAMMLTFGGGFLSLYSKIDRMSAQTVSIGKVLELRTLWMQRQEETNRRQDESLQRTDERYSPLPYSDNIPHQ